jgi:pimeloyl-ACP methyl ester carboxylesterase
MGGLVSLLVASKAPELVDSLVLVDPALPTVRLRWDREVAVSLLRPTIPVVGKRSFQKMAEDPQAYVDRLAKLLFVDHSRMADSDKEVSLAMAEERATMPWVAQAFSQASKSLLKVLVKRKAFAEMVTSIPVDALIVQGEQDRLVDVEAARWLHQQRPDWTLDVYPQVGHVPQLEVPAMFMDSVTKWRAAAAKGQPAAS